jgi:HD superfamily phosphodiesterase
MEYSLPSGLKTKRIFVGRKRMDLAVIQKLAFECMGNKSSHSWKEKGNKYYHGERVGKLIITLRKYILPEDESHDEILTVAAWFHDIMNGVENHAEEGAKKTREILAGYCSEYEINDICNIIGVHDDRYSARSLFSDYVKLHQDADHLDHFGTYDIWMEFLYAVHHDQTILDVIEWLRTQTDRDNKFRNELNFEISRLIYDEKSEFVRNFAERLSVEGIGGIWNENEILEKDQVGK